MHLRKWVLAVAAVAIALLIPSTASAQASIAGVVRDASGAVLPGVTVEAASPVLIEKVRSATSDGTGQYRITSLPPGTYSVTMTLPGFSTVKREGLDVSGEGIITVNGEMRVGGVQETITVTGESPLVDVQSTRRQQIVDDETLKSLPATRGYNALVFLVPSITGGSNQIDLMPAMRIFYSHGGRGNEGRVSVDGLSVGSAFNGGGVSGYIVDTNSQEMQVGLSGGLGETEMGGATVNFVPKTGGNTFAGNAFFSNAGKWSQGSNLDDRLRGFGLGDPPQLYKTWDYSASLGGPIKRDKLWFYGTYRDIGSHDQILGMYANANAGNANSWSYLPDSNAWISNIYVHGDAWLADVPTCEGGTGGGSQNSPNQRQVWAANVNVRQDTTTSSAVVTTIPAPTTVAIKCQWHGTPVTDQGYTNDGWSYLPDYNGWISNIYIKGTAWLDGIPECTAPPHAS